MDTETSEVVRLLKSLDRSALLRTELDRLDKRIKQLEETIQLQTLRSLGHDQT